MFLHKNVSPSFIASTLKYKNVTWEFTSTFLIATGRGKVCTGISSRFYTLMPQERSLLEAYMCSSNPTRERRPLQSKTHSPSFALSLPPLQPHCSCSDTWPNHEASHYIRNMMTLAQFWPTLSASWWHAHPWIMSARFQWKFSASQWHMRTCCSSSPSHPKQDQKCSPPHNDLSTDSPCQCTTSPCAGTEIRGYTKI